MTNLKEIPINYYSQN